MIDNYHFTLSDDDPDFISHKERLEFLDKNLKPFVKNKKVFDFCCGTGMNGIYALEYGAKHVTFTDVRQQTFENWQKEQNISLSNEIYTWQFFDADCVYYHKNEIAIEQLDIIIYHGHFYHARNHMEIINFFSDSSANRILFETKGFDNAGLDMYWYKEDTDRYLNTWHATRSHELCGSPNRNLCRAMFESRGWKLSDETIVDWIGENRKVRQCWVR